MATEEAKIANTDEVVERSEACLSDFFKNNTLTDMVLRNPTSKGNMR